MYLCNFVQLQDNNQKLKLQAWYVWEQQGNHSHSHSNWNLGGGAVVYKAITHTVTATEIWVVVQLYTRQSLTQWQQLKSGWWWCSCIQGNHSHSHSNWNLGGGAVVYKAITHTVKATEIWVVVVQLYTRQSLTQSQQLKSGWWCSCIQGNHSHSDSNWNLGDGAVVYKAITHTVTAT